MKRIDAVLGAAGLALCFLVVSRIGRVELIHELKAARFGLPILVGFTFLRLMLQTAAWAVALRAEGIRTPVYELMGIRLASQAAGYLSVVGPAVSEPMRVRLILKCRGSGMLATLADSGVYGLTSCIFGIIGSLCAVFAAVHSGHLAVLALLTFGLLAGIFMIVRSKPILAPLVQLLGHRSPIWLGKGAQIEIEVRQFGKSHRIPILVMIWSDLACQMLLVGDIAVIAWCLGFPFHPVTVLALEAGTRAARLVAGWIPARIGVDESGAVAAFAALGLPSASGLALALSRRMRDLLGCALGFSWLLWRARSLRASAPDAAHPRLLPSIGIRGEHAVAVE